MTHDTHPEASNPTVPQLVERINALTPDQVAKEVGPIFAIGGTSLRGIIAQDPENQFENSLEDAIRRTINPDTADSLGLGAASMYINLLQDSTAYQITDTVIRAQRFIGIISDPLKKTQMYQTLAHQSSRAFAIVFHETDDAGQKQQTATAIRNTFDNSIEALNEVSSNKEESSATIIKRELKEIAHISVAAHEYLSEFQNESLELQLIIGGIGATPVRAFNEAYQISFRESDPLEQVKLQHDVVIDMLESSRNTDLKPSNISNELFTQALRFLEEIRSGFNFSELTGSKIPAAEKCSILHSVIMELVENFDEYNNAEFGEIEGRTESLIHTITELLSTSIGFIDESEKDSDEEHIEDVKVLEDLWAIGTKAAGKIINIDQEKAKELYILSYQLADIEDKLRADGLTLSRTQVINRLNFKAKSIINREIALYLYSLADELGSGDEDLKKINAVSCIRYLLSKTGSSTESVASEMGDGLKESVLIQSGKYNTTKKDNLLELQRLRVLFGEPEDEKDKQLVNELNSKIAIIEDEIIKTRKQSVGSATAELFIRFSGQEPTSE